MNKPENIDDYIAAAPAEAQPYLQRMRALLNHTLPAADETISYAIPCLRWQNTYLLYFAGYKKHVSIYPLPQQGGETFQKALDAYRAGKGTLRFPINQALPETLIAQVAEQLRIEAEILLLARAEKKQKNNAEKKRPENEKR